MITPNEAREKTQRQKDVFVKTFEKNNSSIVQSIEKSIVDGTNHRHKYTKINTSALGIEEINDIRDFLIYKGFTCETDIRSKWLVIRWL